MAKHFPSFDAALAWAKTYARDHMHQGFERWRVVRNGASYAVAFYSVNTGNVTHFAQPETLI